MKFLKALAIVLSAGLFALTSFAPANAFSGLDKPAVETTSSLIKVGHHGKCYKWKWSHGQKYCYKWRYKKCYKWKHDHYGNKYCYKWKWSYYYKGHKKGYGGHGKHYGGGHDGY